MTPVAKLPQDVNKTGIDGTGARFATGTAGVIDTGGKFATSVSATGRKFAAGVRMLIP
jgi:hypothetical protein